MEYKEQLQKAVLDCLEYLDQYRFNSIVSNSKDILDKEGIRQAIRFIRMACMITGIEGYIPVHALTLYCLRYKDHWMKSIY